MVINMGRYESGIDPYRPNQAVTMNPKLRRKTPPIRALFILICTSLLAFLPSSVAFAHANLVKSNPERGAALDKAPQTITLEFSEALDPQLSQVQLIDSHNQVIVKGPGAIDPANPTVMVLALPALPDDNYSAVWQTHSAADGHFANGSVSFSVGKSDPNVSLLPPENVTLPTEAVPALPDILLRWAGYLAAALMGGGIFFGALVWRPAYRASPQPDGSTDDSTAARLLKRQVIIGAGLLALITVLSAIYQAWSVYNLRLQPAFGPALQSVINFDSAWQLWLRIVILAVIVLLTSQLSAPGKSLWIEWPVVLPLVVVVMATFSLKSHSAATNNPLAIALDIIHLTAMSAWFGGLLPLFLALRRTTLPPSTMVPLFTRLALTCVSVLALTGLYNALVQVQTLDALISTSYGVTLLVKVGLFGLLVALGAVNFRILTPRFKKDEANAARHMRLTIRAELILGAFLLGAVGVLSGSSPAFEATQAKRQMGVIGEYGQDGVQMRLWLAPGITGNNEVAVDVSGLPAGGASSNVQVLLRFQLIGGNLGTTQAETKTSDQVRYLVHGSYFTLAGNWNVEAILRRPGQNDILHNFPVYIATDPNDTNATNPIPVTPDSLADGKALYQDHCVICHGASGKGDGPAGLALNPPPADLTYHTIPGVHSDGQLFYWISQGLPRTAMPAFTSIFSEVQRWDIVNFIRTLARPVQK